MYFVDRFAIARGKRHHRAVADAGGISVMGFSDGKHPALRGIELQPVVLEAAPGAKFPQHRIVKRERALHVVASERHVSNHRVLLSGAYLPKSIACPIPNRS